MAAYSTGASWSFPRDLPGNWVDAEPEEADGKGTPHGDRAGHDEAHTWAPEPEQAKPPPASTQSGRRRRAHFPPRQCRICLETVLPSFNEGPGFALPAAFQRAPRPTYVSPEGGRLLRPCRCKGSQKYVHEECLVAWRFQDPTRRRNYWECPTCRYRYRLQRLSWGRYIASAGSQIALTALIFILAMFVLGFVADPIINFYLDPVTTIATAGGPTGSLIFEDEEPGWTEHFAKGLTTLGLLGFAKFLLAWPLQWFNMRGGIYIGGGTRAGTTGRDRVTSTMLLAIIIGIVTFLYALWKGVRAVCRRLLQSAGERVMDVPGADDDDDDDE